MYDTDLPPATRARHSSPRWENTALAGEDVAAAWGVGQILQRARQPHADFPIRGDGDGEVAERFVAGADGLDTVPGALPPGAPPGRGQLRGGEIVAGLGQPFATLDDMHTVVVPIGANPAQFGSQPLHATLLGKPLGLTRVALRQLGPPACAALLGSEGVAGGLGQPLLDGGDRRLQPDNVAVLGIPGQPVLGVIAGDDRVGPTCTRLCRQRLLSIVEPVPARLPPGRAINRRIQRLGSGDGG
jgi:hypothetical protein